MLKQFAFIALFAFSKGAYADAPVLVADPIGLDHSNGLLVKDAIFKTLNSELNMKIAPMEAGGCGDVSCLVEKATEGEAQYLVAVDVIDLGGIYLATITFNNLIETSEPVTAEVQAESIQDLVENLKTSLASFAKLAIVKIEKRTKKPQKPKKKKKATVKPKKKAKAIAEPKTPTPKQSAAPTGRCVTFKAGMAQFQSLSFSTLGVEVALKRSSPFEFVFGIEANTTERTSVTDSGEAAMSDGEHDDYIDDMDTMSSNINIIPIDGHDDTGDDGNDLDESSTKNTILPLYIGLRYVMNNPFQPFVGGDLMFIPGYVRVDSALATGLRLRTGVNYPLHHRAELHLNLSVGFWHGDYFNMVEDGLSDTGSYAELSTGLRFRF